MTSNGTTKYRVEQLEKSYKKISDRLYEIQTNHLPHIDAELASLKTRVNVATVINVGAIILAAVILKFV